MLELTVAEPNHRLDLRLLGTFGVRINRRTVRVGPPKLRALFAVLALQAGETLSLDRLVQAVWNDAQPDNPRRAVQLYVTRLRGLLTHADADGIISTYPDGYRINVKPEQTDLGRFQRYLQQAKEAASGGDVEAESSALGQALAQWRGEPFADTPSELLRREVAPRLIEQRLRALERHFVLELRRGRHAEVIDELMALTAKYPLRERLWAQLIAALANCGRRAEALAAYHTVRQCLANELGVDPGKELRLLFTRLLAEDESQTNGYVMADSIADLAANATEIRSWHAQILPQPLQTADYAHALIRCGCSPSLELEQRRHAVRDGRPLAGRRNARTLNFILDEAVLRRPVGGTQVMLGQLNALLECCTCARLSIRVVPISIGGYPEIGRGSFSIFICREPITPDVVFTESAAGGVLVHDAEQVRHCRATFARIAKFALSEQDSAALIADIVRSEPYFGPS